jgi:hypothetical protein
MPILLIFGPSLILRGNVGDVLANLDLVDIKCHLYKALMVGINVMVRRWP